MKKFTTSDLVTTSLFSAVIAVFSQLALPSPTGMPVTLQTFIIALTGFVLGSAKGTASVLVYIAVGMAGIPVFTGFQGGLSSIFGPTGGFIFGFIPMAFFCGIKSEKLSARLFYALIGTAACHVCGVLWFSLSAGDVLNAFLMASAPYILKDIISVAAAQLVAKKVRVITQKFN
ncbi:MAG: biotin transporter BioY [Ruminiclostridium sp.]|nr:biotin transporter BioY [Ruminiclostridium sp.]